MWVLTTVIKASQADATTMQLTGGDFICFLNKISVRKPKMLVLNNYCN